MKDLQKKVIHTLRYFSFFSYAPSLKEIHRYFPSKISFGRLEQEIKVLLESRTIKEIRSEKHMKYTLGEYMKGAKSQQIKLENSLEKLQKVRKFVNILAAFPQIKLIGLSGSVAMMNAENNDDVDIFIIAEKNRMWTARMIGLVLGNFMGVRRKRNQKNVKDKVCLNLFFDIRDLRIPKHKQSEYGAHEVLQMKPLVNKDKTYEKFLKANNWVFKMFPNARINSKLNINRIPLTISISNRILTGAWPVLRYGIRMTGVQRILEYILKHLQLFIIRRHQTKEIITDTQLWFFPDDFEMKWKDSNKK